MRYTYLKNKIIGLRGQNESSHVAPDALFLILNIELELILAAPLTATVEYPFEI